MEAVGNLFNLLFLGPITNLLVLSYKLLDSVHLPGSLGFAIVALTVIIRFLVWPLMTSQIRATKKMADLKPHMDELKKKHSSDKQALAQAQMALYKEHGVNPAGGCLPALLQIPVFIALYQAVINILPGLGQSHLDWINSLLYNPFLHLNEYPDPNFFGLGLGIKPSEFGQYGWIVLTVPVITAALTFVQSKMTMPKPVKLYPGDSSKEKKEKQTSEDAMASVQGQMVYLMPVMIGYFAFTFPIGLAIYWNTYTILGIFQQYRIAGWGGAGDIITRISNFKFKI